MLRTRGLYFLTDHLGSTVALADSSGAIVLSTSYDSFGNAAPKQVAGRAASSAGKAAPNIATTYRYTGREYDSDTGLYYYRNRWYDPEVGRFISEDPIGFAGGDTNLYGYVGNNPYSFRDPHGENPLVAVAFLFGVAVHIALNPSYVNAPAPCKPVIREIDDFSVGGILGAAAGMAGGPVLGKVAGAVLRGAAGAISKGLGAAGRAIGRGIDKASKSVTRSNPSAPKGVSNPVPDTVARVVPDTPITRASGSLGRPGADDVFVTAADDIRGLNARQIADRLTIEPSPTGFRVIEFPTPNSGIASPINRTNRGFVGGGRTAGGAREFVIPNAQIPIGATKRIVQ